MLLNCLTSLSFIEMRDLIYMALKQMGDFIFCSITILVHDITFQDDFDLSRIFAYIH